MTTTKVFRPHLDDVERLSYGKGAKKQRGTGSRFTCHRLNRDERKNYELGKQAGFLTVRGTGYRKERKGSPLHNIFRQRCDALEQVCIILEKYTAEDLVVIDFSTLRVFDDSLFVSPILNLLKVKYPDLYLNVTSSDAQGENAQKQNARILSKNSVYTPIDWEAVQTRPIWGVDERIITVPCARDVAKALALDVLKESQKFELLVASHTQKSEENSSYNNKVAEILPIDLDDDVITKDNRKSEAHDNHNDDDSIDWDDI